MFRRRFGIPSNIHGIERFVWGLYSAPIHSLQFPVVGLCHFATFVNYVLSSYPDESWYKPAFDDAYRKKLLDAIRRRIGKRIGEPSPTAGRGCAA